MLDLEVKAAQPLNIDHFRFFFISDFVCTGGTSHLHVNPFIQFALDSCLFLLIFLLLYLSGIEYEIRSFDDHSLLYPARQRASDIDSISVPRPELARTPRRRRWMRKSSRIARWEHCATLKIWPRILRMPVVNLSHLMNPFLVSGL